MCRQTYRHILEGNVSHVVIGTALPGVVQPEAKGTGVAPVKCNKFAESAVLDIDGPIVDLHSPNREVPANHKRTDVHLELTE